MNSRILAIRAISSFYVLEIIKPILIIVAALLSILVGLGFYLTINVSIWWLILLIIVLCVTFVVTAVSLAALYIARSIAPAMTSSQKTAAKSYVKNLNDVTEGLHTPQFLIVFKILLDLVKRRWQNGFIYKIINNSTSLKKDFESLALSFEKPHI